jgi:hypothetical protein
MPLCVGVGGFLRKSASIWSWNDFDRGSFASEHVSRFLYCGVLPRGERGKGRGDRHRKRKESSISVSL